MAIYTIANCNKLPEGKPLLMVTNGYQPVYPYLS